MIDPPSTYLCAFAVATRYLDRHTDRCTRSAREDLAQEIAIEVWRRAREVREPRRLGSYVCTISRRVRSRALERARARPVQSLRDPRAVEAVEPRDSVRVDGRWHDRALVLDVLDREIDAIGLLNARIVRGFYEGFSCRELGVRYGLTEAAVKVRLHRGRRRIRWAVQRRLRRMSPPE